MPWMVTAWYDWGVATAAHAEDSKPATGDPSEGIDWRLDMWRAELGYRGAFVSHPEDNVFSTQDYFSQVFIALSRTVYVWGRLRSPLGLLGTTAPLGLRIVRRRRRLSSCTALVSRPAPTLAIGATDSREPLQASPTNTRRLRWWHPECAVQVSLALRDGCQRRVCD